VIVSKDMFDAAAEQLADNRKHMRQRHRGLGYLL